MHRERSARLEQRKRQRFLPFAFDPRALRIELLSYRLDDESAVECGAEVGATAEDTQLRIESEWTRLVLSLRVHIDLDRINAVLPEHERASWPAKALLLIEEPNAFVRRARLVTAKPEPHPMVQLELDRAEVAGTLSISPWMVRTSNSTPPRTGYAHEPGQRLARGPALLVHFDAPSARPGQFLDVRYKSFSEDPALEKQSNRLYRLETHGQPQLLLNSDHEHIVNVLSSKGTTGWAARSREVFFDVISMGVWQRLFAGAVEGLSEDGQSTHEWHDGVLRELLPLIFSQHRNHQARVQELLVLKDEPDAWSQLAEMCDLALQVRLDLVKHMSALAAAGSRAAGAKPRA